MCGQFGNQLGSDYLSDVTLIVEGRRFPAHRFVLATRSDYFRAMFQEGMCESTQKEITLEETPLEAFKVLLSFVYSGEVELELTRPIQEVLDLLGVANMYLFSGLQNALVEHLKSILANGNVCAVFGVAYLLTIEGLINACLKTIKASSAEIANSEGLLHLTAAALAHLVGQHSIREIDAFQMVHRWINAHPGQQDAHSKLLKAIKLALLTADELSEIVRPTGLFTKGELLDAVQASIRECQSYPDP